MVKSTVCDNSITSKKKIRTRSTKITCCDFSPDRWSKFPSSFFCSNCDKWDAWDVTSNKQQSIRHRAIPCILHLESQMLLKNIYMALREGLSNAQAKAHPETMHLGSINRREQVFTKAICNVMNRDILDPHNNVAQWKFPIEKQKGDRVNKDWHNQHWEILQVNINVKVQQNYRTMHHWKTEGKEVEICCIKLQCGNKDFAAETDILQWWPKVVSVTCG